MHGKKEVYFLWREDLILFRWGLQSRITLFASCSKTKKDHGDVTTDIHWHRFPSMEYAGIKATKKVDLTHKSAARLSKKLGRTGPTNTWH
jgi:hypothetical protein